MADTPLITRTDAPLVRALVRAQFPHYAELAVEYADHGWDNTLFRLGDDLAVRLPNREQAIETIQREQHWLPQITPQLPTSTPDLVAIGHPTAEFPYPWSIVKWVPGIIAMPLTLTQRNNCAAELGHALAALHQPAPHDAPVNPYRGVPLSHRAGAVQDRLSSPELAPHKDVLLALMDVPDYQGVPLWCHGDVHPGNFVLTTELGLAGIIDFNDLTSGDPAVDLSAGWISFDGEGRSRFFDAYFSRTQLGAMERDHYIARSHAWAIATFVSSVITASLATPLYKMNARIALAQVLIG